MIGEVRAERRRQRIFSERLLHLLQLIEEYFIDFQVELLFLSNELREILAGDLRFFAGELIDDGHELISRTDLLRSARTVRVFEFFQTLLVVRN